MLVGRDTDWLTVPQAARESGLPEYLLRACLAEDHPNHLPHLSIERKDGKRQTYIGRAVFETWLEGRMR